MAIIDCEYVVVSEKRTTLTIHLRKSTLGWMLPAIVTMSEIVSYCLGDHSESVIVQGVRSILCGSNGTGTTKQW